MYSKAETLLCQQMFVYQGYGFPVVMYGCDSWTVKKSQRWKIDAFELWCWRRFLTVPWTSRKSNQASLKQISPQISLEGMMLTLKLQYFGHRMQRVDSLEKTLMLGWIGGSRRRRRQRMRWLDIITDSMAVSWVTPGSWWWTWRPCVLRFMGSQRVRHDRATEWTELNWSHLSSTSLNIISWFLLFIPSTFLSSSVPYGRKWYPHEASHSGLKCCNHISAFYFSLTSHLIVQ